jgi:hypothetical protein
MSDESKQVVDSDSPLKAVRGEDFVNLYANHLISDSTAWDMKLTFGQFEETDGKTVIRQKAAINLPFGLAKLAIYWMQIAIIAHEIETGRKVNIRQNMRPPAPPEPSSELANDPTVTEYYNVVKKLYEDFIASLG